MRRFRELLVTLCRAVDVFVWVALPMHRGREGRGFPAFLALFSHPFLSPVYLNLICSLFSEQHI